MNAGREVTTHEKVLSYKGWRGAGYIIIDPNSGAGAYLIEGGANGGFAFALGLAAGAMIAAILIGSLAGGFAAAATAPFILGLIGPILAFFAIMLALIAYIYKDDELVRGCFLGGLTFNLSLYFGSLGNTWSAVAATVSGGWGINSWSACYAD